MIVFEKPFNEDKLRLAYNNDVIRFYSSNTAAPVSCDVSFTGVEIRLYPNPQGRFYFNFKPYIGALLNTNDFQDTLETHLETPEPETFVYPYDNGMVFSSEMVITINLDNNSTDAITYNLQWLGGAEQLNDFHEYDKFGIYILSPVNKDNLNRYYLKYWEGYPFDIPIYFPYLNISLLNQMNGLSQAFEFNSKVTRLYISDGRTDETIEDMLPLVQGRNSLRMIIDDTPEETDKYIDLEKIPYKCGVYFKWLNNLGGYSYWLFENTYSVDRSTKSIGELDRDYDNLEDTFARSIQIGKESQDTVRVISDLLNAEEVRILSGIFDSPKIYMFTGTPFSQNDYRDWVEVSLKTGNARIKNARQPMNNFVLDFELPMRYTQTL